MKNLFKFLMAVAVLFTASCAKEDISSSIATGETVEVTFSANLTDLGTRTTTDYGDGSEITTLRYYVYSANEAGQNVALLSELSSSTGIVVGTSSTVNLVLIKGMKYNILFWADNGSNVYSVNNGVVSFDPEAVIMANDESRDAFYAVRKSFDPATATADDTNVTLKRPFAQLNAIVSNMDDVDNSITLTTSTISTKIYTTLNPFAANENEVVGGLTAEPVQFTAAVMSGTPAEGHLSMNFLLAPAGGCLANVAFTFNNEQGVNITGTSYDNIPLKANYKTNIIGNLLTGSTNFNVTINPIFEGEVKPAATAQDILAAIASDTTNDGKTTEIVLEGDIDLNDLTRAADPSITIGKGKEITINLNGKKLTATSTLTGKNYNMLDVNGGTLTVKNGTIEYEHKGENMGWNNSTNLFNVTAGGVLNLEGVTAKNLGGSDMAFVAHLNNWGEATLNVNNSTLESTYIAVRAFNSGYDMNNVTIKNSTLKGKFCFWVHNYKAAGDSAGTDDTLNIDIYNNNNTFEYTGKAPVLYGFNYPLYFNAYGYQIISTDDFSDLAVDGVITLTDDIALTEGITIANGESLTINLAGKTISGTEKATGSFGLFTNKGNLTINDSVGGGKIQLTATNNREWNAYSSVISNTVGGVLVVNGGTIEHLGGTDMAYGIDILTNGKGTSAVATINGGHIKSPYRAVRQFLNGIEANNSLTVNGGVIEGANKSIWMQDPSKNANTGSLVVADNAQLKGDVYLFVTAGSTEWPVSVSIAEAALVAPSTVISGNVPAGYAVVNQNDVWSVELSYADYIDNGTVKGYVIYSANGLKAVAEKEIKGGYEILLGANIDLTGVEFNGLSAFNSENNNTFDGKGYTVSNWTNNSGASDMGFIRNWVGTIKNVNFENCHLKTSGRSAIAAAKVYGNIENVHVNNCSIEDSYWACGLIAGLYNAGNISDCSATNSLVKSNGGTGAIVGVINETAGTRSLTNCSVSGTTVNNTGAYGEVYSGALLCGMINISNSTVKFVDCSYENNTKEGKYVGDLYYAADDNTIVIE